MSWVKEGNSRYLIVPIWRNGKVTSLYMARERTGGSAKSGPPAGEQIERRTEEWRRWKAVEAAGARLTELVRALHDACLLVSGYHRCASNYHWRPVGTPQRRNPHQAGPQQAGPQQAVPHEGELDDRTNAMAKKNEKAMDRARTTAEVKMLHTFMDAQDQGLEPAAASAFLQLVQRVDHDRPEPEDLVKLELALRTQRGLWRLVADFARDAIERMLDEAGASPSARLAFLRGATELRATLAGAESSPLEAALAEQIAVSWMRLRIFELWLSNVMNSGDATLIEFWDSRVSRAQARYLEACEALARVRRFAVRTPRLLQTGAGNEMGQRVQEAARRLSEAGEGSEEPPEDAGLAGKGGRKGRKDEAAG